MVVVSSTVDVEVNGSSVVPVDVVVPIPVSVVAVTSVLVVSGALVVSELELVVPELCVKLLVDSRGIDVGSGVGSTTGDGVTGLADGSFTGISVGITGVPVGLSTGITVGIGVG